MLKRLVVALALLCAARAASAQSPVCTAPIPVQGTAFIDNFGNPLVKGLVTFTVTDNTDTPITYTVQGGSPSTATFTSPIKNGTMAITIAGQQFTIPCAATTTPSNIVFRITVTDPTGSIVYDYLPLTAISGPNYSFNSYTVPAGQTVSGIGNPRLSCVPSAIYNDNALPGTIPWACSKLLTDQTTVWTQNPSSSPACGLGFAVAQPKYGQSYCLPSSAAYSMPNFVFAGPLTGVTPGPVALVPSSSVVTASIPNGAVPFTNATHVQIPGSLHKLGTANLLTQCNDTQTPPTELRYSRRTINLITFDVDFYFAIPVSGYCVVNGTGGATTPSTYYVMKSGDTMIGPLILSSDPTAALGAATKRYVDTKLSLTGGTLSGPLILSGDPSTALGAATKQYADTKLSLTGGTLTGPVTSSSSVSAATLIDPTRSFLFGQGAPCYHFGDSITAGYYAQPADGTGNVYSTHGYANLLDTAMGWTCTNDGVSGSQLQDAAQADVIMQTTFAPNTIATILTGANDMRSIYCTGCVQGMSTPTAQLQYLSELEWLGSWAATPAANHALGTTCPSTPNNPSCVFSGTWTAAPAYGVNQTIVPGSSVTVYLVGSAIYLSSLMQTGNSSTYSVTVDGNPVPGSPFNTLGYIGRTGNDTTRNYGRNMIRAAGLAETQHAVVLTCVTASVGNPCYFSGATSNGANTSAVQPIQATGPNFYIGNTLRASNAGYAAFGGSDTIVGQFDGLVREAAAELASDGLHVQLVDTSAVMNPNNLSLYWGDQFHPDNLGHSMLANAFVNAITASALPNDRGSAQILQGVNLCTLNGGMVAGGCPSIGLLRGQIGSITGPLTGAVLFGADGGGIARTAATNYVLTNGSGASPEFSAGDLQAINGDLLLGTDGGGIFRTAVNSIELLGSSAGFNLLQFGGTTATYPALAFSGAGGPSVAAVLADGSGTTIDFRAKSYAATNLAGTGNALACIDANGKLYRGTATTCP